MDTQSHKLSKTQCYIIWGVVFFLFVVFILVFCLTQSPTIVKCNVTNALLTNSSLALNITIRNPNGFYHVRHDHIDITVSYKNQTLSSVSNYASFSQGRKHETQLTPSFNGLILGGADDLCRSNNCEDKFYNIILKLRMQDEFKKQIVPRNRYERHLEYTCELKVPSGSGSSFNTTLCRFLEIP